MAFNMPQTLSPDSIPLSEHWARSRSLAAPPPLEDPSMQPTLPESDHFHSNQMLIPLQLLVWKANGASGLEQGGVCQLTERPLGPVVVAGPGGA